MTKIRARFYFLSLLTLSIITLGLFIGLGTNRLRSVAAAGKETETIDLRIIGTTDLHGQLNSNDYEQGVDYNNGGLARVFDLIKKTKAELPEGNTITLDAGDVLFDYTTEYIFSANQEAIQPIYKAMKHIGYDAITLGNHEFDYGYDYLLRQLDGSGLRDITIVTNLTDARTGEHPFQENMLINRMVKTRSGKEIEIKIGIIGQTIPTLTGKTHSYEGILIGEDMVENARTQAANLKEMGADIIIALSHTGIGPENPEPKFKNVAYALTKIPEIDAVIAGHEHNLYPTSDMSNAYYKLPGVDKNTYLMNGKNVVMAGDRGKAIGVIDFALEIKGDYVYIADRKSSLRMVTEKNTEEDNVIAKMFGEWEDQLLHYASDVLAKLDPETALQNYYGLLSDNAAIQLLNDSKIHYALNKIKSNEKEYIDYPIIAASTYESFGVKSINDFINIKDKITEADLTTLQNYNSYLYVYTITGAQLREWLEWSASAYETIVRETPWQDSTMSSLMEETKLKSLIREEWLNDWSNFYVFDGISYDIDPSRYPRYDLSGNRINVTTRVSNIYYQGKEVTDDMELLIATNKITKPTTANKGIENQSVLRGFVRSQSVLARYISQLSKSGSILPQVDNNWRLILPNNYQFIVKVPYYAKNLFEETPWFQTYLTQKEGYSYYAASVPNKAEDKTGPHIVISPLITNPTASSYEIAVQAADDSRIKYLKYLDEEYDIDNDIWVIGRDIPSKGFSVWKNGIYSVYSEDIHGNKAIRRIVIDNFNDNLLPKPIVDNYTNRKSKISGKAEPNTVLVIETPGGIYEEKINRNGTFSVALPGQLAETNITVYVKDDERGLESERVEVRIKRTGPNQPLINPMNNNSNHITGNARDHTTSVIAVIDNTVYVSKDGGKMLFEANKEIYNPKLKIIETLVDVSHDGQFIIILPPQEAGTSVKVYAIDHVSRNSRMSTITVNDVAPNAPVVNEVSNIERSITGYVPSASNTNVELHLEDKTYNTRTDKKGRFSFTFDEQLYAGQSLVVVATDMKDGRERNSYPIEVIVNDIEAYVRPDSTNLTLNRVTNKSNVISGYYYAGGSVNVAIANGEGKDFRSNIYSTQTGFKDKFIHYLDEKLDIGTKVYVMVRFVDGRILLVKSFTVTAGRPSMPTLLRDITNTDKIVNIVGIKDTEIVLLIGNKTYTSNEYYLDEVTGQYIYTLETDREQSGTTAVVTATNQSGTSDPLVTKIVKTAPDSPMVNEVYEGDNIITGSIELLDYALPEEELPKEFNNAPPEVAKTQTRVYAQIGTKKYKGTIDSDGSFAIDIPKQLEGTPIKLWGTNKAGRGPLIKILVTK
jgi:2',3'-cyclic-nucleotide 2'-phosphodiesterase/3'-nucleotidase